MEFDIGKQRRGYHCCSAWSSNCVGIATTLQETSSGSSRSWRDSSVRDSRVRVGRHAQRTTCAPTLEAGLAICVAYPSRAQTLVSVGSSSVLQQDSGPHTGLGTQAWQTSTDQQSHRSVTPTAIARFEAILSLHANNGTARQSLRSNPAVSMNDG